MLLAIGCIIGLANQTWALNSNVVNNEGDAVKNSADGSSSIFTVGGTYDTMSDHPTNAKTCLKIGDDPNYTQLKNQQATLDFSSTIDSATLQNALGKEFTATYGWGPFVVKRSYQYAKSSQDDNFTMNINYAYQYNGKAAFKSGVLPQGKSALTEQALTLVATDPVGFRNLCGDNFVSELNAGVSVLMRLSLKFNSHNEKNAFDSSYHAAVGLSDVLSTIKTNTSGINYELSIAGIQVGGDPSQLDNLFISHGGTIGSDGYPILSCGNSKNNNYASCTDLINLVIGYANSVSNQLKNIDDYNLYNPTVEPWSALGIFPGIVEPDKNTLKAMQDIAIQLDNDQNSLTFLNNYLHMLNSFKLLSSTMNNDLSNLINKYNRVINIYYDPANMLYNCYGGYVSTQCIKIHDNIFKQRNSILSDTRLNNLLLYLQSQQYSVDLLTNNSMPELKTECALSPISDESFNQYLINCNGYASGTLNGSSALIIKYDSVKNALNVRNLNYSYPASNSSAALLNFNYVTDQPLIIDAFYNNVWSNIFDVQLNGKKIGADELVLVKNYY
ncbi:MAG: hypothetical protein KBD37_01240 [Burkholderiales bacterium]|nr:hypothetical protein [Burkholderiales bacterium]